MLRDETIRRVIQFRDDREWRQFHTPKDLAISLSLEAAELLEIFQWSGADLECRDKLGRIREELERISIAVETLQLWSERMLATGALTLNGMRNMSAACGAGLNRVFCRGSGNRGA